MQPQCNVLVFVVLCSVVNSVLFQKPLYSAALDSLRGWGPAGYWPLATVFVLQLTTTITVLSLASLLSLRLLKVLCVALLACSATALYFMDTYGVVLDRTMMGNVFNTDLQEALDLFHFRLLAYLGVLAVLPSVALVRVRVTQTSLTRRASFLGATVCIALLWTYANARSWLWIDQNSGRLGGLVLPWSYVVNSIRYVAAAPGSAPRQMLLPPAYPTTPGRVVVVLVIGESARAANFSLYGYQRQTNPVLAKSGVVAMKNTRACSTSTTVSVRCILSHEGSRSGRDAYELLPTYLQRQAVDVLWRSNNWGEPPLQVGSFERAQDIARGCRGSRCDRLAYDEVLLRGLAEKLRAPGSEKRLVVLHQAGSHGPRYFTKYPAEFQVFKPVCVTVDLSKCRDEELVNAYDNSVLYSDYVLGRLISILRSLETPAVMLYVSDHGESLGENGLYLHGIPYAIAPDAQTTVPFIVWASDAFLHERGLNLARLDRRRGYSHDFIFHSVMGALGLTSAIYKRDLDIFARAPDGL